MMFKNFFHRRAQPLVDSIVPTDFSTLEIAAEMLTAPSAMMQLSLAEARAVAAYMRPRFIADGTVFIREGDDQDTGFMVLVLDGDVAVENFVLSRVAPVIVTVLGAGSMHGELGLIDGLPRSASCTAVSDLHCVVLTREGMLQLLEDDPAMGAKLMMAIAMRIAARLRDNSEKLKKYVQLTSALQQEIDHLIPG